MRDDLRKQVLELFYPALNGLCVKQVGVVSNIPAKLCLIVPNIELEIKSRRDGRQFDGIDGKPGEIQWLMGSVLQAEQHLDQRIATRIAFHLQLIDQRIKRQLGMSVRIDTRFPGLVRAVQRT